MLWALSTLCSGWTEGKRCLCETCWTQVSENVDKMETVASRLLQGGVRDFLLQLNIQLVSYRFDLMTRESLMGTKWKKNWQLLTLHCSVTQFHINR